MQLVTYGFDVARAHARMRFRQLSPATVVTGAAEGLGLALASIIAREGRSVLLLARTQDALDAAKERLRPENPSAKVIAVQVDAGQPDAPDLIDEALAKSGLYLDVLVNNAGIGLEGSFCTLAPEKLEELVQTNITTVTRLARCYLPAMRARARGGIMNIASIAAFTPGPWQSVYFASKQPVVDRGHWIGMLGRRRAHLRAGTGTDRNPHPRKEGDDNNVL